MNKILKSIGIFILAFFPFSILFGLIFGIGFLHPHTNACNFGVIENYSYDPYSGEAIIPISFSANNSSCYNLKEKYENKNASYSGNCYILDKRGNILFTKPLEDVASFDGKRINILDIEGGDSISCSGDLILK